MKINYEKLYSLAEKYLEEGTGSPWNDLHDFICNEDVVIFGKDFDDFADKFLRYLGVFGMRRSGKLSRTRLKNILQVGKKTFVKYIADGNPDNYVKSWKLLRTLLKKKTLSTTEVMISKIMMGLNGNSVALDKNFKHVFLNNPYLSYIGIEAIALGLESTGHPQLKTPEGGNLIPWPRILDMAFWQAYRDKDWDIMI